MKRTIRCLTLICICIVSGCATWQPERLAQRYCEAHQGYWDVVADNAFDIAPQKTMGIRFMRSVVNAMSKRESEELRFLLIHGPRRVQTGPEDAPWIIFELTDSEYHQLSSLDAVKQWDALSSTWIDHPNKQEIQKVWQQASSTPSSKAAWVAKDNKLNALIREIEYLKSRRGQQSPAPYFK